MTSLAPPAASVVSLSRETFRRTLVIGSGGAGKSTLARRLGALLDLPVIHLDVHFWRPGWVATPDATWDAAIEQLSSGVHWVMDGNFSRTLPQRLARATAVVFLDYPRLLCLRQALLRLYQYNGQTRPDMREGCAEQFDWEFLLWVWNFPQRSRPSVWNLLETRSSELPLLRLRRPREAEDFLHQIEQTIAGSRTPVREVDADQAGNRLSQA